MQILPIDLTAIVAIVLGMSVILIPVAGLTLRFALKPTVEALARTFEKQGLEDSVEILERRMDLLEQQMEGLDHSVNRMVEAVEFQNKLQSGEE